MCSRSLLSFMLPPPPTPPLFPYTTLFRSLCCCCGQLRRGACPQQYSPCSSHASAPPVQPRHWLSTAAPSTSVRQSVADRKSTRLNSSHVAISYAVFCLKKKKKQNSIYNPV